MANTSGFWTGGSGGGVPEPKRGFQWVMLINGIPEWVIKKVTKPSWAISETEHKYLNHTFYYPGRLTWETIDVTLVDPITPDVSKMVLDKLIQGGYQFPTDSTAAQGTIGKNSAMGQLGTVKIQQLSSFSSPSTGEAVVAEEWELVNAWIKDVKFGELDYDSEDMVEVTLTLRFDYAMLSESPGISQ